MENNKCLIISIVLLSALLYIFVLNNSNKEYFTNNNKSLNVQCAKKRSPETYLYASMLEKRGAILRPIGESCNLDIDCASRYCKNEKCTPLCGPKGSSNYLKFKL
jgi:hypothetical protein